MRKVFWCTSPSGQIFNFTCSFLNSQVLLFLVLLTDRCHQQLTGLQAISNYYSHTITTILLWILLILLSHCYYCLIMNINLITLPYCHCVWLWIIINLIQVRYICEERQWRMMEGRVIKSTKLRKVEKTALPKSWLILLIGSSRCRGARNTCRRDSWPSAMSTAVWPTLSL